MIKFQLLGMKSVLENQDSQMFGLKSNKYEQFSPTWSDTIKLKS